MEGLEADKRKRTSEEESAEEISKRTANLKKTKNKKPVGLAAKFFWITGYLCTQ